MAADTVECRRTSACAGAVDGVEVVGEASCRRASTERLEVARLRMEALDAGGVDGGVGAGAGVDRGAEISHLGRRRSGVSRGLVSRLEGTVEGAGIGEPYPVTRLERSLAWAKSQMPARASDGLDANVSPAGDAVDSAHKADKCGRPAGIRRT